MVYTGGGSSGCTAAGCRAEIETRYALLRSTASERMVTAALHIVQMAKCNPAAEIATKSYQQTLAHSREVLGNIASAYKA